MATFQEILSKPRSEIKPPSPITPGTYLAIIDGPGEFVKIGKNQTDALKVNYKLMQVYKDVDEAALQQLLVEEGKSLQDFRVSVNWFITEAAVFRLEQHLENHLGIEKGTKGLGESIPEMAGKQVYVTVGHRSSEDGQAVFNEAKGFAKV